MTIRHALLPIAGALVLGLGVYLLIQVRTEASHPASDPPARREVAHAASAPPSAPAPAPAPAAPPPVREAARSAQPEPLRTVPREPSPMSGGGSAAGSAAAETEELIGTKLDAAMAEANGAYDRSDYEEAKQIASRVLAKYPTNVRMLRIMVSASCIEGDSAVALASYARLPLPDQQQMKIRCARYGFSFPEKPDKP